MKLTERDEITDLDNNSFIHVVQSGESFKATILNLLKVVQAKLVSGTNIKTINSTTLLGSGDIKLEPKRTNKPVPESSYILLATDVDKFLIFSNACTVVVPNGLAANLEFQGKQGGTGQVTFSAESGGTLNVPSVFLAETAEQHCFFGIRTDGGDVSTILGTLKLA